MKSRGQTGTKIDPAGAHLSESFCNSAGSRRPRRVRAGALVAVLLASAACGLAIGAGVLSSGESQPPSSNNAMTQDTTTTSEPAARNPASFSTPVGYEITFDQRGGQLVDITYVIAAWDQETLEVHLPVWRPGRYEVLDVAGTVRRLEARDASGAVLPVEKFAKSSWRVATPGGGTVRIAYQIYANSIANRTRHVDDTHAFLSGACIFLYCDAMRNAPATVMLDLPPGWRVACGLSPRSEGEANAFVAKHYDELVDCPIEAGIQVAEQFEVNGVPHEHVFWGRTDVLSERVEDGTAPKKEETSEDLETADVVADADATESLSNDGKTPEKSGVEQSWAEASQDKPRAEGEHAPGEPQPLGDEAEQKPTSLERIVRDTQRIARVQQAFFGKLPCDRYLFITHIGAGLGGGTEHLNSTILQCKPDTFRDAKAYRNFLSLVSHEYFHTWNVKNFRPKGLKPYEYQRENYTTLLWVAEGTTSYYDELLCVRAGVWTPAQYFESLADLLYSEANRPGARLQSLEGASFDAWVKFNKPTPDSANSTVSFYSKGALVNFLLDADIRASSGNAASLDGVMRALNERFPLAGTTTYDNDSILTILRELTRKDYSSFFDSYVRGTAPIDPSPALEVFGLEWKPEEAQGAAKGADEPNSKVAKRKRPSTLGVELRDTDGAAVVVSVKAGGPAFDESMPAQWLLASDQIIALNEVRVHTADIEAMLKRSQPGETINITLFRREKLITLPFVLGSGPEPKQGLRRVKTPTSAQRAAYESWLGQPWPKDKPKK